MLSAILTATSVILLVILLMIISSILLYSNYSEKICEVTLDDLNRKATLNIDITQDSLFIGQKILDEVWVIATVENCGLLSKKDLARILRALRNTGIEELVLKRVKPPLEINSAWLNGIKTVRSVSFVDSTVSCQLLNEVRMAPQIECLKISGRKTEWLYERHEAPESMENIQSLVVKNTKKGFFSAFLGSMSFSPVRDLHLDSSGLRSFRALASAELTNLRKLRIRHEVLDGATLGDIAKFKHLESLSILRSKVLHAPLAEDRAPVVALFKKMWQFKIERSVYDKMQRICAFQTNEKNIHICMHYAREKYFVEYTPIYNKTWRIFKTQDSGSVLQVKVADIVEEDALSETPQNAEKKDQSSLQLPFLREEPMQEVAITIEISRSKQEMQKLLRRIMDKTKAYTPSKIAVYFSKSCPIDRKYIKRILKDEGYPSLAEVRFNNMLLCSPKLQRPQSVTSLHLVRVETKDNKHTWKALDKKSQKSDIFL
ncbi:uncharacterized protein NEMAJ01_1641 [Nematocida major]|uniref:uncharacterized protein n=1 Tax=Nematocida major TaxID=1912982 RepID=UPI0020077ABD|nr:uncharacterized protein NEMAJ01_1641 [Nematocida major]KAH9386745.1 hypothetical protein NEMAJ01_1641 [Nematocida major]